ncbi:MAG TPA: LysM peptidoglycan-binding domain-containing protein [Candidatus Hydrothermia bacterium]|nr:LysM peptidoglycan-binding domain-containing protein [Candidatus Hydrothermia bacterium]HOK23462.1 LysM peptidoglycan-binding domain-containing protein [Candidatus Hydrothermia bacterium]HOL24004.1 LysM peptidoglycan-binding domain-containing protein [Candidatus Hydrothermia bacterium]HPO79261.1 LysM peptidoglycan-binding domain-containing protein [Candidatus Hydrothermia bacterium]HRD23562.1 LysM peptidoglycan-binding domain-containing protein [Candidatus Hydrothermia bacterium]
MKKGLLVLVMVSGVLAQGFKGTYADIPLPIDSKWPTIHISTFGGFKLIDDYFTDTAYKAVLPPYGIALGFSTSRIFANVGYAKHRGFEVSFHHTLIKSRFFKALWGVNGLLIPDIESEHTVYIPEDSTEKVYRVPAFAAIYFTPHRIISGGIGVGLGKYGIRSYFDEPLYIPGVFFEVNFTPIKEVSLFWEGYTRTYRRNIGITVIPTEFLEIFGFVRYAQYWPYNDTKLRQLFVGVRFNVPIGKEEEEVVPPPPPVVTVEPEEKVEEPAPPPPPPPPPPEEEEVEVIIEEKPEEEELPTEYIVQEGDFLTKIAGYSFIYNDSSKWRIIYEANKDQIKDPNLIYPGQRLVIPR